LKLLLICKYNYENLLKSNKESCDFCYDIVRYVLDYDISYLNIITSKQE